MRTSWRTLTPTELAQRPGSSAWAELCRRMDLLTGDALRAFIAAIRPMVARWPLHVSRTPLKHWDARDPRMDVCRVIKETSTYGDYCVELAKQVRTSRGMPAAILMRRQFVGQVTNMAGKQMQINKAGMLDIVGATLIEVCGVELPVYTEIDPKMDGGEESPEQVTRVSSINNMNGVAFFAYGIADAVQKLKARKSELEKKLRGE